MGESKWFFYEIPTEVHVCVAPARVNNGSFWRCTCGQHWFAAKQGWRKMGKRRWCWKLRRALIKYEGWVL